MNPENTFFSVKRFIGRKMNEVKDESKQVRRALLPGEGGGDASQRALLQATAEGQ